MSHTIELTDEQYATLEQAARERDATPTDMLADLIAELRARDSAPQAYETEDWFRHLGLTEEQIAASKRIAADRNAERNEEDGNADAL